MNQEKEKKLVPILDLDSNEFEEKILTSLRLTGYFNLVLPSTFGGRGKELDRFGFALMNSKSSKRRLCRACGGYHYIFSARFELDSEKDETCLCSRCAAILAVLAQLRAPEQKIQDWLSSKGEIDPFDILRDSTEKLIKEGGVEIKRYTGTVKE